jgi:hypothetical protein
VEEGRVLRRGTALLDGRIRSVTLEDGLHACEVRSDRGEVGLVGCEVELRACEVWLVRCDEGPEPGEGA